MRFGNILLWAALAALVAHSTFGPLQVDATYSSCQGVSYAARKTQDGYRLCFQDTVDQPNICTSAAGKDPWGYVVPPLNSAVTADLVLRPEDGKCSSTRTVVGNATFTCTLDNYGKLASVTLTVRNSPSVDLISQRFFIGCKPNYLVDCQTLDAARTPDCTDGIGIGYIDASGSRRKTCGGVLLRYNGGTPTTPVKRITVKVNSRFGDVTGCKTCEDFWWGVRQNGTYC